MSIEEIIQAIENSSTVFEAANSLGVYPGTIYKRLKKAGLRVVRPELPKLKVEKI